MENNNVDDKDVRREEFPVAEKGHEAIKILAFESAIGLPFSIWAILVFSVNFFEVFIGIAISIVLFFGPFACLLLLIKRPQVIVTNDGKYLHIYYKQNWEKIELTEIVNVRYIVGTFMTVPLKSGSLIIKTKDKRYRLNSVANVAEAASKIEFIIG